VRPERVDYRFLIGDDGFQVSVLSITDAPPLFLGHGASIATHDLTGDMQLHSILDERLNPLCDLIGESKLAIMSDGVQLGDMFASNINIAQDFRNEPTKALIDGTSVSDYLWAIAESVDLERELLPLKSDLL
jgi:hypothetical protein